LAFLVLSGGITGVHAVKRFRQVAEGEAASGCARNGQTARVQPLVDDVAVAAGVFAVEGELAGDGVAVTEKLADEDATRLVPSVAVKVAVQV
jgi:hypothetical protein